MNRRNFLKFASVGALAAGTAVPGTALAAAKNKPPIPGALGMLYDSTLCVGCQACVAECQRLNGNPANPAGAQTWSNNDKLTPYTNNIIQVWKSGTGEHKDQLVDGYAYIKKQCMHCVNPNCVSVCPVQALKKIPRPASFTTTRASAPAVATAWWVARSMCPNMTTTIRWGRSTSASSATKRGLSGSIRASCPAVSRCAPLAPSSSVSARS